MDKNNIGKDNIERLLGLPLEIVSDKLEKSGFKVSAIETKPPNIETLTGEKRVISITYLNEKDVKIIYSIFNTEPKRND